MRMINSRANFLTGLVILIPIAVSLWLLNLFVGGLAKLGFLLPEDLQFQNLAFSGRVVFIVLAGMALFIGLSFVGWFSKRYFGRRLLVYFQRLMVRIPVLGTVYSSLDQLLSTLMSGNSKQFRRVVYLEFPKKGTWAIGFVTGPAHPQGMEPGYLNVFVPTVPNPTSGFHMLVHEREVKESHLTVEQAFKTILSLGIAQPTPKVES